MLKKKHLIRINYKKELFYICLALNLKLFILPIILSQILSLLIIEIKMQVLTIFD